MTACLLGFAAIFLLMALRIPIAVAMGVVGYLGLGFLRNFDMSLASVLDVVRSTGFSYTLSVVPLFILMGNFTARAGMARELFDLARAFLGHRRGGLAMASIGACAGFGAVCGSSVATAATMAKVAYPSMKEQGYSDELSTGAISAGGTLGILIPPSTIMVIYGLMTETSIGKMFAAGVLPGILMTVLMCGAVAWTTWRNPKAGAATRRFNWSERLRALGSVWSVVVLFALVMGGIYGGLFTATEGAGFGAFGAFIFALTRGNLSRTELGSILVESARTTAMLFAIFMGAMMFANFVNFTGMPDQLQAFVMQFDVHPITVILAICAIYVILGTAMEELSMILLTVPVFFPLVIQLGFDPHWFGILIVCVVMIGLISPPVGMNLFVLATLLPNVKTIVVFRGVLPFITAQLIGLGLLIAFPAISLWALQFIN
jgi:tripartite ATP-independent transporter DctM subunit